MPVRKLLTLYAPMAKETAQQIMSPATALMDAFGFKWWLSPEDYPDMTVMIDCPEEWHQRGPSPREMDTFFELFRSGRVEEAREFAKTGFPEYLR